jgi:hypothetical protein
MAMMTIDYNVCLFAYGQSGSGKTYSMVGVPKIRDQWGIVPRIGEDICRQMAANNANPNRTHTWKLSVTMVEIYREIVRDLLIDNSPEIKVTRGPDPNQKGKEKTIMVVCLTLLHCLFIVRPIHKFAMIHDTHDRVCIHHQLKIGMNYLH